MRERILLHACCAPDLTVPYLRLKRHYEVVAFFYNPNIHYEGEYMLRLREAERLAGLWGFELIRGEYMPQDWFAAVRGLEGEPEGGERCRVCFRHRLERTARLASELGFRWFATTLTISPHKDVRAVNQEGERVGEAYGVRYLRTEFRKRDGFRESVRFSRLLRMYRQRYCGCVFSMR